MPSNFIKAFFRDKCFCLRNFINKITKDMCFTEDELKEIKERVLRTRQSEQKFNEWEKVIPDVKNAINGLHDEAKTLSLENSILKNALEELFIADCKNDTAKKHEIYTKFGFIKNIKE